MSICDVTSVDHVRNAEMSVFFVAVNDNELFPNSNVGWKKAAAAAYL